jgi:CheY-like chemotaxis protein
MESALLNLAINARDAMPNGGKLTLTASNSRLTEADLAGPGPQAQPAAGLGYYVMVTVTDTGTGMDAATKARLFEPFFTTKSAGKGSGLGMAIVYGFIAQLGGHIRVESEPGAGTTIRLYLPRARSQVAVAEEESPPAPAVGGTESILLVEDHELVRRQVEAQLTSLGYRVTVARDGVEALEILKMRGDFDLLFTDVVMPHGVSGLDLAREAAVLRPGLPVLFTSSYSDNVLAQQGRLDPAVNLLCKPYGRDVLAAKLRHALDRSRRRAMA